MQVAEVTWKKMDDAHFDSGLTVWRGEDSTTSFLPLPPGKYLSWKILGPKRCIGSVNVSGKLERCPEQTPILRSGQKCGPCQATDIVDPCMRCDGRRCDAVEARRLQCDVTSYVVYAAVFSDKTLKVGVSSKGRALTRWVEQGADYACILREIEGGRAARRIEERIGRLQGITKQVRSGRKVRALSCRLPLEDANALTQEFLNNASHLELDSEIMLHDLSAYYTLGELESEPMVWKKNSEPVNGQTIIGKVLGMKGSLIVIQAGSFNTVIDLKQIIGYTIDIDSDITLVTQTGLSDFF
jgi:hypothetical protein